MDTRQYLDFHRFAIEKQFEIILEYQKRLKIATREADVARARATDRAVEYVAAEADPDEIFIERDIRLRYDWMLSAHRESVVYRLKLQEIEQHLSGINQLCGLILQSAKQGISTVHGNSGWDVGRVVGSMEPLGNVILQARNQAFHFEEGDPRPKLKACYAHLHADFGIPDDLTQNLARFVVIDVLGWDSYEAYHMDMLSNF